MGWGSPQFSLGGGILVSNLESTALLNRARRVIPGGVNSPVRAFKSVGGTPRFITSAEGAFLKDVDGNQLLDFVGSWGVMVLGHAHPNVTQALHEAARLGTVQAERRLGWGA